MPSQPTVSPAGLTPPPMAGHVFSPLALSVYVFLSSVVSFGHPLEFCSCSKAESQCPRTLIPPYPSFDEVSVGFGQQELHVLFHSHSTSALTSFYHAL